MFVFLKVPWNDSSLRIDEEVHIHHSATCVVRNPETWHSATCVEERGVETCHREPHVLERSVEASYSATCVGRGAEASQCHRCRNEY